MLHFSIDEKLIKPIPKETQITVNNAHVKANIIRLLLTINDNIKKNGILEFKGDTIGEEAVKKTLSKSKSKRKKISVKTQKDEIL